MKHPVSTQMRKRIIELRCSQPMLLPLCARCATETSALTIFLPEIVLSVPLTGWRMPSAKQKPLCDGFGQNCQGWKCRPCRVEVI